MNVFDKMLAEPSFPQRESFISKAAQQVNDELTGRNLYELPDEVNQGIFPVDGLCVAYKGITRVFFDMASGGRTTVSNPEPGLPTKQLIVLDATPLGYASTNVDPFYRMHL